MRFWRSRMLGLTWLAMLTAGCLACGDSQEELGYAPGTSAFSALENRERAEVRTDAVPQEPAQAPLAESSASSGGRLENRPPMLVSLGIEPATGDRGDDDVEMWRAVALAEDPDGDSVEFSYRWLLNGAESDVDEELYPAGELVRGDRLEVEVRAYDGRAWSSRVGSGVIEIDNSAPSIVSSPPRPDSLGNFLYRVRAEDPDGDRDLRFSLAEAPEGMQIDEKSGLVKWRPGTDQAGRHDVKIVVTDAGGAEANQSFSIALVTQTEDSVPAAPR